MTEITYSDPHPGLKGSDRVVVACGRCGGSGVYSGPSNASWNNGNGERTWCFWCNGAGTSTVLVSSVRAAERARVKAANARREDEARMAAARGAWVAAGFDVLLASTEALLADGGLRWNDPLRQPLQWAAERLNLFTATEADAQAVRDALQAIEDREAAKLPVVEGRRVIEGVILSVQERDGFRGTEWKMLVDEGSSKVWGSVPREIFLPAERGVRVRFTATVERSRDDAAFGFYSRPTKASIVEG